MAVAGTIGTVTRTAVDGLLGVVKVSIPWTCDAAGAVTEVPVSLPGGTIIKVRTDPDGTNAPTDNYDITLLDAIGGADVINGAGANRDTANIEEAYPTVATYFRPLIGSGDYYPTIANAGNAKQGVIEVYIATGAVL